MLQFDDVMNLQREKIYGQRREVLEGDNIKDQIGGFREALIGDVLTRLVTQRTGRLHLGRRRHRGNTWSTSA